MGYQDNKGLCNTCHPPTPTPTHCRAFWEVVLAFPPEMQKKLLHFSTGSDRVPVGGVADLNFKISRMDVSTDW